MPGVGRPPCWGAGGRRREGIEGRRSMSNRFIGARQTTLAREIELTGHGGAQRSASIGDPASCRSRYWAPLSRHQARPGRRGNPRQRRQRQEPHALHRHRRRQPASRSAPSSIFSPRCAASRSTTASSRSTAKKCRSWTAARRPSSRLIDEVGIRELSAPRKFIKVLKPVRVEEGDCWGELAAALRLPSRRRDRFRHPRSSAVSALPSK